MEKIFNDLQRPNCVVGKREKTYKNRKAVLTAIGCFRRLSYNFFWISMWGNQYKLQFGVIPGELTREYFYTFMLLSDDSHYFKSFLTKGE